MPFSLSGRMPTAIALAALAAAAACTPKSEDRASTDTGAAASAAAGDTAVAGMSHDSTGGMSGMSHDSMAGMTGMSSMPPEDHSAMRMTGSADQDFLRMMSDHHKGLIAMAHLSVEGDKKGTATTQADARKLDTKQDAELDTMVTMLERQFKDAYDPKVMPSNQKMVDELKALSGAGYDRTFYHHVVMHHQQAIKMIDEFTPKLQNADVKRMAQRMKEDQQREIAEFQQKAGRG